MKRLVAKGCEVIDGHQPAIHFANLESVQHLDWIVYESKTARIRAICEVKTTTNWNLRDFEAHGDCVKLMLQARDVGIPIFLAVVRLKNEAPKSIVGKLRDYAIYLLNTLDEYRIEFYEDGNFEIRGNRFFVVSQK